MKPLSTRRPRRAFSLIEMMLVITIIVILIALLLPAVQQAREAARRTQCKNNLAQLGIAMNTYHQSFNTLPPGSVNDKGPIVNEPFGYHISWIVQILPNVDQGSLFQQINFTVGAYDPDNLIDGSGTTPLTQISTFLCPSDPDSSSGPGDYATSYAAITGGWDVAIDVDNEGLMFLNSSVAYKEIRDGASNTIMLGERRLNDFEQQDLGRRSGTGATLRHTAFPINARPEFGFDLSRTPWPPPSVFPNSPPAPPADQAIGGLSSWHAGGIQTSIADGSVRFISENIDPFLFQILGNRADGQMTGEF